MATRPEPVLCRTGAVVAGATLALCGAGGAWAQAETPRSWLIVPRVSATQTFTDNADLSAVGQAEQFTEISPGVRAQVNTARLKAYVDYALRTFVAAQDSRRNHTQNALNASGTLEAWEKWLYLDASATVAQQSISAFGTASTGGANVNANSTETSTFRFSPYARGRLLGNSEYTLRYSRTETRSKTGALAGIVSDDYSAQIRGLVTGPLGWVVDATQQSNAYSGGNTFRSERVTGRLTYRFDPELTAFVSSGSDKNNYGSSQSQSYTTFGWGFDWTPTERTKVAVSRERRSFGDSHSIALSHRTALTALRFSDTRNVSVVPNTTGSVTQGTYYDLLSTQLATLYPDPVARNQAVTALLQQSGISPTASITNGFLASQLSIQRRQELSLVLNGLRNTVTYTLFQADSQSIGNAGAATSDDLSLANTIKSRGMSSNFSHRLTSLTSVNMLSSWMRNVGTNGGLSTTTRVFNVTVSSRLTAKTTGSVGLRNTVSEGTTAYRENAVLGTLTATF